MSIINHIYIYILFFRFFFSLTLNFFLPFLFFFVFIFFNILNIYFSFIIFLAMSDETIETLQQKLKIYQQLFETLAPSAPLNILTPSQSTNTSTPSTLGSLTPSPSLAPAASATSIFKPNMRYIKVEEILKLTGLKKNEYNNLLVRKLIFEYFLLFINIIFYFYFFF